MKEDGRCDDHLNNIPLFPIYIYIYISLHTCIYFGTTYIYIYIYICVCVCVCVFHTYPPLPPHGAGVRDWLRDGLPPHHTTPNKAPAHSTTPLHPAPLPSPLTLRLYVYTCQHTRTCTCSPPHLYIITAARKPL